MTILAGNIGVGETINRQNAKATGQVENHCPFGCKGKELNDRGHCRHLIGFTNDKVNYEPVRPWRILTRDGKGFVSTGAFHVVGALTRPINQDELKKGLIQLVNPTELQTIDGVTHVAEKWVSARVYHKEGQWPQVEKLFCAKCDALLPEAARFCPECGHVAPNTAPKKLQCVNAQCGAILDAGTKFCTECGAAVPETKEPKADKKAG